MPDTSVKSRIIARLLELLEVLKSDNTVRKVARVSHPAVQETMFPAVHLVIGGDEPNGDNNEDTRGYELRFTADVKLICEDHVDPYGKSDELTTRIQTAIEADLQLRQLANKLIYQGEQPFVNEQTKPIGGRILFYDIEYRRLRGDPTANY